MQLIDYINSLTPLITLSAAVILGSVYLINQKKGANSNHIVIDNNVENAETDLGGYAVVDVPEERKSLFQDLLKGFEEYAVAKGYKVSISTDTSIKNKVAFKFTIIEYGITTTPRKVKKDLDEYIERIRNGDPFDDLIEESDSIEDRKVIMALKNRISFLQQNYEVERNIKDFYKDFIQSMKTGSISHLPPTVQINQGAIEMDQKTYSATNSVNTMQGDNHSHMIESGSITIGSTHNERVNQLDKINKLLSFMDSDDERIIKAKRKIESVKDEIEDEEHPDTKSIFKWLSKAKEILKSVNSAKEIYTHAKDVFEVFGM